MNKLKNANVPETIFLFFKMNTKNNYRKMKSPLGLTSARTEVSPGETSWHKISAVLCVISQVGKFKHHVKKKSVCMRRFYGKGDSEQSDWIALVDRAGGHRTYSDALDGITYHIGTSHRAHRTNFQRETHPAKGGKGGDFFSCLFHKPP